MGLEHFAPDWAMPGVRVARRRDGVVEIDLVWRSRGSVQIIEPITSSRNHGAAITNGQYHDIHRRILQAVDEAMLSFEVGLPIDEVWLGE
jgi:hypothetical protein